MSRYAKNLIFLAALTLATTPALGASGGGELLQRAATDVGNRASLQRGAKLFVNYCMGCHSAQYMRYNRMGEDLGLSEAQLEENFIFDRDKKVTDKMTVAMRGNDAGNWFGVAPPDLSLTARSRGVDWIYTFLKSYYPDPNQSTGWNNVLFKGTSMPNPLWHLQGIREPVFETQTNDMGVERRVLTGWDQLSEGQEGEAEFDRTVRDLTTFLEYMGEPARLQRESIGVWVLLYLALFTVLAYFLKLEFWRDIH